jgi:SAM-dependent methyltransferase
MANIIFPTIQEGIDFNEKKGRGLHSYSLEADNITTRYLFAQRIPVLPPTSSFIDLGCGSGEALLLALQKGCRRPVVGIDLDRQLLLRDTKPKLEQHGFVHRRDFILIAVDLGHPQAATAIATELLNRVTPAPTTFDVVLCQKPWINTLPAKRMNLLNNCIALGKPGGMLHFSLAPRYSQDEIPTNASIQTSPTVSNLSPTGCVLNTKTSTANNPGNLIQTPHGLRPRIVVAGAIQIAPQQQWVDAENQASAVLTAANLSAATATFLHLGSGLEYNLPAGRAPQPDNLFRPYDFGYNYTGFANWSAHWTAVALSRPQTASNSTYHLVKEAEDMAGDVIVNTIMAQASRQTDVTTQATAVEVLVSVRL